MNFSPVSTDCKPVQFGARQKVTRIKDYEAPIAGTVARRMGWVDYDAVVITNPRISISKLLSGVQIPEVTADSVRGARLRACNETPEGKVSAQVRLDSSSTPFEVGMNTEFSVHTWHVKLDDPAIELMLRVPQDGEPATITVSRPDRNRRSLGLLGGKMHTFRTYTEKDPGFAELAKAIKATAAPFEERIQKRLQADTPSISSFASAFFMPGLELVDPERFVLRDPFVLSSEDDYLLLGAPPVERIGCSLNPRRADGTAYLGEGYLETEVRVSMDRNAQDPSFYLLELPTANIRLIGKGENRVIKVVYKQDDRYVAHTYRPGDEGFDAFAAEIKNICESLRAPIERGITLLPRR